MNAPYRALLSVTDKTGLVTFAQSLVTAGYDLISTGGTARTLREAGLAVQDIADVTGFPEMLGGRVKTLHPVVHGGILADRRLPDHCAQIAEAGIAPIDLVVVNLYAFEQTVTGPHEWEEAVESIDIGGPAMIRSAAKNHANVTVVVDPEDYPRVAEAAQAGTLPELRRALAAKAFRHTAYYDSVIARYFTEAAGESAFTETMTIGLRRGTAFRYGENPHQSGALYHDPIGQPGLLRGQPIYGLEMGYNNWNDADGAWELVSDLPQPACAITKHGNPCGAALADTYAEAFRMARDADPISAFGGVVAINGICDAETTEALCEKGNKLDVVIATGFDEAALARFRNRKGWGQDVRLIVAPPSASAPTLTGRLLRGGALLQTSDEDPGLEWQVVTQKGPTEAQLAALKFLWKIIPHVKSNAIVVGSSTRLLGVGAGQMNRVQSVRLALEQAGSLAKGAALASDAFFPFPDSIETAARAGIAALVQPGGSKKDPDVIAAADAHGLAMVMTGVRRFRH